MNDQQLKHLRADIALITGQTVIGTARLSNLLVAARRMRAWTATAPPITDERGGSSSPTETAERQEDRRVAHQALRDLADFPTLHAGWEQETVIARTLGAPTPELLKIAERFAALVRRYTIPVDHDLIPVEHDECRSCARPAKLNGRQYPGHKGIPVFAKKLVLCRWCYDHHRAEGHLPPVDVIDIYHRVSPRAAGIELAKRTKGKR